MIVIYADGKKIYDPRIEKLQLEEAELSQTKNKAGSITFTIPAAHTYAQNPIIPGITRIVVKEDEEIVFKGRITKNNPNFWDDSECTAEGDLAYLNDTVVRPYEYAGSPREYFAFLVEQHNAQVEKERQFAVGRVTVADPNDYIVRSSAQYPSTWEELETKLLDSMGGFLVERWEDGVTYLDYLAEIRENNEQVAKYGENIVDIDRIKEIDSGFATAVIPLGKKQESEDGKEAQYLTIKSINNGIDYVQNDDAVSKYGLILKTVEHEDVTLPENLLRKGKEDLTEAIKSVESITVTAADLSGTGVKVESFRFMKNVRCMSKRHGLDFRSPIVSLTRNLLDRSDYKITVGDTQKSYTGASITSKRETESKAEEIINLEREVRKKAIEDLVSKVEKAPGLYITDTGEGEAHNWYLHDKKTVEESYIIIRVNAAGIIFSTDGGKTYNGVSWEGDAILKKIYAIGIDANHINAGELNAAIVKIKNLHLQDISDDKGVTLDATLNGITADVSSKYTELDGKISNNSASISLLPNSITSTVKTTYIDPLTTRMENAEASIKINEQGIESKVSKGSIISTINQSEETITISARKIDFNGSVTFSNAVKNASDALSTATGISQGLSDGTTKITGNCLETGRIKVGTASYLDMGGAFKIGSMQSVGELNDDVEFKHAIFVDYGIELLAGNDGATPYIDFHTEAINHDKAAYDYTARLQNTQKSWMTFYGLSDGKNAPAGCTVQSAQFRGTLVNDSDRRLKQDIVDLNIDEVLNEISKYRPVSYKYINGVDDNVHHGLIAQEAQEIAQWGLVDDRGEYLAINYIDLISDLIKTTQYSLKEIEKLKTIIDN